jgi:pyruvate/2-oxoglutarate dehydrogenase complex dihydrolipoamide acyltransferase (E2) component
MPNIDLEPKDDVSSFRRIAIGTWETTYDPSVYGTMEVRMDRAVEYLAAFRKATGKRLTVTHMVAKAVGAALARMPDANAILRFNKIYLRKRVGVFFQVAMDDEGEAKIDLSGATLYDVEQKSLATIIDEFEEKVGKVKRREDPALEGTRSALKKIPFALMNTTMKALSFLNYTLNLDLTKFGVPKDAFGSVMITNIGSIGLDQAFVPLVPYSRVPILIALGAVREQPVAENGQVVVGKVMKVNATFDHRFIDGLHAAIMSKVLREHMDQPFELFDKI